MRAKHIIGDFEGAKTFLTPKLFCQHTKITSQTIGISRTFVFLCTGATIFQKCFRLIVNYRFLIVFMKLQLTIIETHNWVITKWEEKYQVNNTCKS